MILIIAAALILTVIGYLILPETLVMQITFTGERGTTMPKALGLAIPLAISTVFSVLYYKSNIFKHFLGSMVGILAFVLVFIFNL
jgi:hypothetical protein